MSSFILKRKTFTKYDETDAIKRMKDSDILAQEKKRPASYKGVLRDATLGAIGGAAVLWLLSGFGYITDAAQLEAGAVQPESALLALRWLMSFIPAAVAALAILVVWFYPLTTKRIHEINTELKNLRSIE